LYRFTPILLASLLLATPARADADEALISLHATRDAHATTLHIQLATGWRLNPEATPDRALILDLDEPSLRLDARDLATPTAQTPRHTLTLPAQTRSLRGQLTALLCAHDRCRRVTLPISITLE
jgi:hypothetical protein